MNYLKIIFKIDQISFNIINYRIKIITKKKKKKPLQKFFNSSSTLSNI